MAIDRNNPGIIGILGLILLAAGKYGYSKAGSDQLLWILSPTACWVKILSGISFEYVPRTGYVNHAYRFILAASCSGVRFMMISFTMLFFTFLPRMKGRKSALLWMSLSAALSYLYTIFVNGWRILVSIFLPLSLEKADIFFVSGKWLTPDRLHTIIGTSVYFSSLLLLHAAAEIFFHHKAASRTRQDLCPSSRDASLRLMFRKKGFWLIPAFWYFALVLVIPFFNQVYRHNFQAFASYAGLVSVVCLPILLALFLLCQLLSEKS